MSAVQWETPNFGYYFGCGRATAGDPNDLDVVNLPDGFEVLNSEWALASETYLHVIRDMKLEPVVIGAPVLHRPLDVFHRHSLVGGLLREAGEFGVGSET
jgi:hypothetical protein